MQLCVNYLSTSPAKPRVALGCLGLVGLVGLVGPFGSHLHPNIFRVRCCRFFCSCSHWGFCICFNFGFGIAGTILKNFEHKVTFALRAHVALIGLHNLSLIHI